MLDIWFVQILLLLGTTVGVVVLFQRLHVPSSLGYLLVGVMLGPHTAGPVIADEKIEAAAEFGIVFLLFAIGLNFSLPQIRSLRNVVLGLGTGQVLLTTLVIGILAWLAGLPPAAAFVAGAVAAQSSTTVISKQLAEQGEEHSRHGRLATALSVFQDVTTVPLVVLIPALGSSAARDDLGGSLGWALAKAIIAFLLVFLIGRRLLHPLFHVVASRRSAELFTLTVLFVSLGAAGMTHSLGLSMAFGGFLVGMILGETEFRHQMESTIRPFRDVLLGLFFVSIGMLFDPSAITGIWQWAVAGAAGLLASKAVLVALMARAFGIDALTAWRAGLLIAVGGEFGFALLALALNAGVIAQQPAQITLTAVLFSMIAAPLLIRYNHELASMLVPAQPVRQGEEIAIPTGDDALRDHTVICGYGRIGQSVAHFLEEENMSYVALDLDPSRVKEARAAGVPVFYGDASERDMLEAVGVGNARLVVVCHEDIAAALKILHYVRAQRPALPVMVRTRDESHVEDLMRAGATEVVPETLEASLMIASQALLLLNVPLTRVVRRILKEQTERYRLLREFYRGDSAFFDDQAAQDGDRLTPVRLAPGSRAIGCTLAELALAGAVVTALVRQGHRHLSPPLDTRLQEGDVVVLFGSAEDVRNAESLLLSGPASEPRRLVGRRPSKSG